MTNKVATSKSRLVKYLDFKGVSKLAFYRQTGLNRGLIDTDKLHQQLTSDKIATIIATYKDLNLDWLITGEGDMLKQSTPVEITPIHTKYTEATIEKQYIPYYSWEATAGVVQLFDDDPEYEVGKIIIPRMPKCDGAMSVTGDSMYPLLKNGDIVAYSLIHDLHNIHYGDMYIVSLNEDGDIYTAVKWVQQHPTDPSKVLLVSNNENYAPREVELRHIRHIALVKFSIRYNAMC